MLRLLVHLLYALTFSLVALVLVLLGQEAVGQLGQGSYIRWRGEWVDLQFHHVLPIAWKNFQKSMFEAFMQAVLAVAWAGLVTWSLRNMRSILQPVCAFVLGASGGLLLFMFVTRYLGGIGGSTLAYLYALVLSFGAAAYALSAVRMNRGIQARIGDVALIAVSIAFSIGWNFLLVKVAHSG